MGTMGRDTEKGTQTFTCSPQHHPCKLPGGLSKFSYLAILQTENDFSLLFRWLGGRSKRLRMPVATVVSKILAFQTRCH